MEVLNVKCHMYDVGAILTKLSSDKDFKEWTF